MAGVDAGAIPQGPSDLAGAATRVRFELSPALVPAFDAQPWPSVAAADASGAPLGPPGRWPGQDAVYTASMLSSLSSLDGFGTAGPVYFHFDGDLDTASLPDTPEASAQAGASLFVIDVDTNSASPFARVPLRFYYDSEARRLAAMPARGHLFSPGTRYAAVATTGLRDADGLPIGPSDDLVALQVVGQGGEVGERYRALLSALAAQGVAAETVAGVTSFRVQSAALPEPMPDPAVEQPESFVVTALQGDALATVLGPVRAGEEGLQPEEGFDYDGLGALIQLRVSVPNLRSADAGRPGTFERGDDGTWLTRRTEPITVTLLLPKAEAIDGPVPVVFYAHGWGRDRSDTLALARRWCRRGFALVAIDAPQHGTRLPEADREGRFTGVAEPDGFGDRLGDPLSLHTPGLAGSAVDPTDFRDLPRQWALDIRATIKALGTLPEGALSALEPYQSLRLDVDKVAVIGEGTGGTAAMMVAATDPAVGALVLAGVGAGMDDWLHMPGWADAREALARRLELAAPLQGGAAWPPEVAFSTGFGLFVTLADAARPLAWATRLRSSPVHVLLLRAEHDDMVSARGVEALARVLGADFDASDDVSAAPLDNPEVTRLLLRFPSATRQALVDRTGLLRFRVDGDDVERLQTPVRIDNPVADIQGAALAFLESWRDCLSAPPGCQVSLPAD